MRPDTDIFGGIRMRHLVSILFAALLLSACGQDKDRASKDAAEAASEAALDEATGTPAVLTHNLPLTACLEEQSADAELESSQCPTFILLALDYMIQECAAGGGTLKPMEDPEA